MYSSHQPHSDNQIVFFHLRFTLDRWRIQQEKRSALLQPCTPRLWLTALPSPSSRPRAAGRNDLWRTSRHSALPSLEVIPEQCHKACPVPLAKHFDGAAKLVSSLGNNLQHWVYWKSCAAPAVVSPARRLKRELTNSGRDPPWSWREPGGRLRHAHFLYRIKFWEMPEVEPRECQCRPSLPQHRGASSSNLHCSLFTVVMLIKFFL